MTKIVFTKSPNCYDALGAPYFYSLCNKFRILYIRTGRVKHGKCPHENYYVHCNLSKKKSHKWDNFIGIGGNPFRSKLAAKIACRKYRERKKK